MNVLVLHSDVAPNAPPDELDTLVAADAVVAALKMHGHEVSSAAFTSDPDRFERLIDRASADVVFNLVEGINGLGQHAPIAPRMLDDCGAVFTGADAIAMATTNDKPLTKRKLREAGVATPDWTEPQSWRGLKDATYIVKSALEDASYGLDDGCVVTGKEKVKIRAADCYLKYGGRWFAEEFIDGREFNIAVLQGPDGPAVLPMAEMVFESWPADRPRIVGYTAKWDDASFESVQTVRHFGVETKEPALAAKLKSACEKCWEIFDLAGYARIDFRVTKDGEPLVLEINTNPGIAPDAGFAAAAAQAGMSYDELIERILAAASLR
ncbi:MAG: D-alanine--D-alanine ligase family protein [Rhizomicrobium sp.]